MKAIKLFFACFLLCSILAFDLKAQWTRDSNGNFIYPTNTSDRLTVGFLSSHTPAYRLEVNGSVRLHSLFDHNNLNYFLDPNGSSVLSSLTLTSSFTGTSGSFTNLSASSLNLSGALTTTGITNNGGVTYTASSTSLNFLSGTGGNGVGTIYHNSGGFSIQAPGYGTDMPNPGGDVRIIGGISEDYEGGDIIVEAGYGITRNGQIILDSQNNSMVGVGFSPNTTLQSKLDVNGSVRATSYITVSDKNLKTKITDLEGGLNKTLRLRGVTYSFKQDESSQGNFKLPNTVQLGFIAQEVEEIIPEAVVTDGNGVKGVDYTKIIPVLVEALKEQNKSIVELQNELFELKHSDKRELVSEGENKLYQNIPNPSNGNTIINYKISGGEGGQLYIFDLRGIQVKKIQLLSTENSVTISNSEFSPGLYIYSLVINGREVASKRMILE